MMRIDALQLPGIQRRDQAEVVAPMDTESALWYLEGNNLVMDAAVCASILHTGYILPQAEESKAKAKSWSWSWSWA